MTGRERRERDPTLLALVKARLARMRVARAARETQALRDRWPAENILEAVYLRRRDDERGQGARDEDG